MSRQNTTATSCASDPLLVVPELMGAPAISVLGECTDDAGLCAMCGSAWPCEHVVLAASNLVVI